MMPTAIAPAPSQPERVRALLGDLLPHDAWSRERLLAHQQTRLRALLEHAVTSSPYYRRMLGPHAPEAPLEELPTLPKATLMERFDEVVCDPRLRLADLKAHLESGSAEPFLGEYRVASTSGSTGLRGVFAFTRREFGVWTAVCLRAMVRVGAAPGARLVAIGAPSPAAVTRQLFADFQAATPDAPRLSVVTPVPELIEALNAYQPEGLVGYPTIAGILAGEQLAGRLRIQPRWGLYGAEPLTPMIRRRIRAAWGFEPGSIYAATEALGIGSSTPGDECFEMSEDVLVVEVVDERDRPVAPGTPGAKVLITNLVSYAQPLIRYELSDVVTLAGGPNPSGRPYRRIASLEGRRMDTLVPAGPRRRRGRVAPDRPQPGLREPAGRVRVPGAARPAGPARPGGARLRRRRGHARAPAARADRRHRARRRGPAARRRDRGGGAGARAGSGRQAHAGQVDHAEPARRPGGLRPFPEPPRRRDPVFTGPGPQCWASPRRESLR
jgi:phenylacetate-CoA ligase